MVVGLSGCQSHRLAQDLERAQNAPSLEAFLEIDRGLGLSDAPPSLAERLDAFGEPCPEADPACIARSVARTIQAVGESQAAVPEANSLTGTLTRKRGSCAALTVTAMLADQTGTLRAAVFRDHVMVVIPGQQNRFLEILEGGREAELSEINRHALLDSGGPHVVNLDGFRPYYLDNLAVRFSEAGDAERAEIAFGRALELAPNLPRIRYNYGSFLLGRGNPGSAAEEISAAIGAGWEQAPAYINLAVAFSKLGKRKQAETALVRALELDPRNKLAKANLEALQAKP